MQALIRKVVKGQDLTRHEAREAFERIMSGQASEVEIAALLTGLACKGESTEELTGAAEAMREKVTPVRCDDPDAVDTCGTGGDGISTFNVSTASAIVAAAAGATVAKHGNRTNTRASGSAEALDALGVNINAGVATVEECLRDARIGFLFAINLHPAMKHAAPVRKALGIRTIFNLLGPMTNPAGVRRQVLGVNRPGLTETIARVLGELGAVHAMVVHGMDGLCDLTVTGPSRISELRDRKVRTFTIEPESLGLSRAALEDVAVASPEESAKVIREVLAGKPGAPRDIVLLNAGAALVVAGKVEDLKGGVARAAEAIDSQEAAGTLIRLVGLSRGS
ncbi:MAG: anthranilate phosphoribosyltransferase [Phycisphaerae bacterium]|nr:anthranilate phosphoribosyltransferase [Phycisphaerae bacterium]